MKLTNGGKGWEGIPEGEVANEKETCDKTWSPRLASQPRLCWVVCLRCNGVPLGLQEEHPRHFWVSPFATSSACLLRQAGGSPTWAKAPPPGCWPAEVGWHTSLQHSSSWYICSSNSWDSRCSSRSVRPLIISSGVFINLGKRR